VVGDASVIGNAYDTDQHGKGVVLELDSEGESPFKNTASALFNIHGYSLSHRSPTDAVKMQSRSMLRLYYFPANLYLVLGGHKAEHLVKITILVRLC
jgi:hypothetical protein